LGRDPAFIAADEEDRDRGCDGDGNRDGDWDEEDKNPEDFVDPDGLFARVRAVGVLEGVDEGGRWSLTPALNGSSLPKGLLLSCAVEYWVVDDVADSDEEDSSVVQCWSENGSSTACVVVEANGSLYPPVEGKKACWLEPSGELFIKLFMGEGCRVSNPNDAKGSLSKERMLSCFGLGREATDSISNSS
jgi:hypothetical protein